MTKEIRAFGKSRVAALEHHPPEQRRHDSADGDSDIPLDVCIHARVILTCSSGPKLSKTAARSDAR
jgi:hypothetical protein